MFYVYTYLLWVNKLSDSAILVIMWCHIWYFYAHDIFIKTIKTHVCMKEKNIDKHIWNVIK